MTRTPYRWLLIPLLGAAMALSACGSDDDGTTEGDGTQGSAASASAVVEAPPTSPPTTLGISESLTEKPSAGKKFIFLQCELPSCQEYTEPAKEAAEALGWDFSVVSFKNNDPGSGVTQAIQQKPDYIGITGIPAAVIKQELAAANRAGIKVVGCAAAEKPSPDAYAAMCGATLERDAEYVARWMANDSGGKGKMVTVSIPSFSVLNTETDWQDANLGELCPDCTNENLNVTVEELGAGSVGSKVVAYIQSNPDVEYVYFTAADVSLGTPEAIKSAGLGDKVKLIGCCANSGVISQIGKSQAAWTATGTPSQAWTMIDAAARISIGMELSEQYHQEIGSSPTYVLDTAEAASSLAELDYYWPGPEGFQDEFKKLWKLTD